MERGVEIPDGVEIEIQEKTLVVKGPKGELRRQFIHPKIITEKKSNTVVFRTEYERRRTLSVLGTWKAHLENMINGVQHGYQAKMRVIYSHFPIKLAQQGNKIVVQNFLGERNPRHSQIIGDVKVDIKKDEITFEGVNKEDVGQSAANLEQVTRVKGYDKRVFQDGCFLTLKTKVIERESE